MKRIAYYGGSFDPVHRGHLAVATALVPLFALDAFYFIPAFHAPHKPDSLPASPFHRFAMLTLCTAREPRIFVSPLELETSEKRYTVDTLRELHEQNGDSEIYFVMGADSWLDITTWKEWEEVLTIVNHIVVSRPGYEVSFDHVTEQVRKRMIDIRNVSDSEKAIRIAAPLSQEKMIFITDAVDLPVSASSIRVDARDGQIDRPGDVSDEVAKYIEKYELYR